MVCVRTERGGRIGKKMEETQAFMHDFGWALKKMREGKRVGRKGWSSQSDALAYDWELADG